MAPLQFPNSPVNGDKYPTTPIPGVPVYIYDGEKWKSNTNPPSVVIVSDTPPVGAVDGTMWWESDSGLLYIMYNDGSSRQWVVAAPQPDFATFASKDYVDARTPLHQRFSMTGVKQIDVPVPTGVSVLKFTATLHSPTNASNYLVLQLSVAAGVFITAVGNYVLNGFQHNSMVAPTTIVPQSDASTQNGMLVSNFSSNSYTPIIVEGVLTVRRPTTTTVYTAKTHSSVMLATGTLIADFAHYMTVTNAGSTLNLLAVRFINLGADNFIGESYINVEWL